MWDRYSGLRRELRSASRMYGVVSEILKLFVQAQQILPRLFQSKVENCVLVDSV